MKFLKCITPKNFLGKYTLQQGAKCVGIFMCVVSLLCVLGFLIQFYFYHKCENCSQTVLYNIYGFAINIAVWCLVMFLVDLWFLWGILKGKASVLLCWVVATTIWWLQGSSLVLILLIINIAEMSVTWICTLCLAIAAFFIVGYCILLGYAYWQEIKTHSQPQQANP